MRWAVLVAAAGFVAAAVAVWRSQRGAEVWHVAADDSAHR